MAYCFGPSGVLNPEHVFYGTIAVATGLRLRHRRNKDKDARTSVPARRTLNDSDFPPAVLERRFGALEFRHLSMEGCRNILLDVSVCDGHDPPKSYLHFEFHIGIDFVLYAKLYFCNSTKSFLVIAHYRLVVLEVFQTAQIHRNPSDPAFRRIWPAERSNQCTPLGRCQGGTIWAIFDELRLNSPLGAMHEL